MNFIRIALHPSKNFVVTASDDKTWQLWSVPGFEFWMSGEGHKDWISDCDFHPKGTHLATSSGDCTVKIWDFDKGVCVASFTDHNRVIVLSSLFLQLIQTKETLIIHSLYGDVHFMIPEITL